MDAAELEAAIERDDRLIRDLRDHAIVLAGDDARIPSCGGGSRGDPIRPRLRKHLSKAREFLEAAEVNRDL